MIVLWLLGCTSPPEPPCASHPDTPPPTTAPELRLLVDEVHTGLFPELAGASIDLVELTSETDYFQANLDLGTVGDPPLERAYRVLYNPVLFDDPPPQPAVAAILAHELTHIRDYTEMTASELVEFGIWYATSDTAEYERATDEHALELGCSDGLVQYREWLYTHIPADAVDEKMRVYYTPAEIADWVAANP